LDLVQARENFGADESLLCEIATVFIEDVPLLVAELEQASQRGDTATVCRMAHSLKGLCATFGAEPARTYAQSIEHDCSCANTVTRERIRTLILSLEHTIATLRSELRLSA
jgi:HPt (histidine-containing phosphotransfer) domain-containing protein